MTSAHWTEVIVSHPKGGAFMADFSADLTIFWVSQNRMSILVKNYRKILEIFPFSRTNYLVGLRSAPIRPKKKTSARRISELGDGYNNRRHGAVSIRVSAHPGPPAFKAAGHICCKVEMGVRVGFIAIVMAAHAGKSNFKDFAARLASFKTKARKNLVFSRPTG
jgi:hypothetical protein